MPSPAPPVQRPTVLVVEDDVSIQGLIQAALSEAGYRVLQAYRAADAERLAAAHLEEIDVLVTDEVVPGTSGIEFARRLRASRNSIRVVCMSGYVKEDVSASGGQGLVAAFLFKPFPMESLVATLNELVGRPGAGGH